MVCLWLLEKYHGLPRENSDFFILQIVVEGANSVVNVASASLREEGSEVLKIGCTLVFHPRKSLGNDYFAFLGLCAVEP